jgi:site-specific DNA-methyltransferase (adenine-specific)
MQINQIIKKIGILHSSSTETPTSFDLAKIMVDQIDCDWGDPSLVFLDPACGRGTFLLAIMDKLEKHGHKRKHIINNMLYGIDSSKVQSMIARKSLRLACDVESNIFCDDSLTRKFNMKFDVIVGNPPYQGNNDKGTKQPKSHNLWSKFVDRGVELLNDNGSIAFVTPDSWMSPSSQVLKMFKDNSLIWVDTTVGKYFTVGSSFTAWIMQKNKNTQTALIDSLAVDINNLQYLPRDFASTFPIHNKVINSKGSKLEILFDTTCHSDYKHKKLSDSKDEEYKYETFHTNAQSKFSKIKSKHYSSSKIVWTTSGYFKPFFSKGNLCTTEVCGYILVNDEDDAAKILSYFDSKLYKFIINTGKWSGFLNGKVMSLLPKLESKKWTDDDIYKHFNLSPEEIEYVESNVK